MKSVTISASSETYSTCQGTAGAGLAIPGGACTTPFFTVTDNGTASENVMVEGANAVPSDNGTPWTLGTSSGANEYYEETAESPASQGAAELNVNAPVCDGAFNKGSCAATAGQTGSSEQLLMDGPSSSSDSSSAFTTTVTWTAT